MKRGFLDGGGRFLEGLKHCAKVLGIDSTWEVISYEPAPESFVQACKERDSLPFPVELRQAALWSTDGELQLFTEVSRPTSDGNTVMMAAGRSVDGKSMQPAHIVAAHNINRVLTEFLSRGCQEIHIKLDIEGAEFQVVPRLLRWEHLSRIRSVRVEWHERFFGIERPRYAARRVGLTQRLRIQGIDTFDHW